MTQTIPYREGKHFGTLSIDMNDPEDAIFIEQFKRIPSKNRDYIAALYAREKRRGVNRHIGDHIQPLSLTKQIDEPDVQKSRLTIDKNVLMDTLKRIDEKVQEIQADIDSGKRTKEDADIELKALAAEREKIKARADELGIKIAALSTKSSADGSSPLKPDQLVTIIKKLQEQGNAPDLSAVLSKIENLRSDRGGMMDYVAILSNTIDKLFTYSNGRELDMTNKAVKGITLLNKVLSERAVSGNKSQIRDSIVRALEYVLRLSDLSKNDITTRSGVDMNEYISSALYRRLIDSMLMAIDFDFKDVPGETFRKENIDASKTLALLSDIHKRVDSSLHMDTVNSIDLSETTGGVYKRTASRIINAINGAIDDSNAIRIPDKKGSYIYQMVGAIMGIKVAGDNSALASRIYAIRDKLIESYDNYVKTESGGNTSKILADMSKNIKENVEGNGGNYTNTLIGIAFDIVSAVWKNMSQLKGTNHIRLQYNLYENTIDFIIRDKSKIEGKSLPAKPIFAIDKPESRANIIRLHPAISEQDIFNKLRTVMTVGIETENRIGASKHTIDIPEPVGYATSDVQTEAPNENTVQLYEQDDEPSEATSEAVEKGDVRAIRQRPTYQKRLMEFEDMMNGLHDDDIGELVMDEWVNKYYKPETIAKIATGKLIRKSGAGFSRNVLSSEAGIAGYVKIIDRGNPLKRRY